MALAKFELAHKKTDGKWHFSGDGKSFVTKSDGMAYVMKFGNKHGNCSVKIKKTDGKIQEERTYGKDPKRYRIQDPAVQLTPSVRDKAKKRCRPLL